MTTPSLNIVFAGTPDFAATHLKALIDSHHNVIAVYSQPDRPAGRGKKLQKSAVKQVAEQHELPVYQPLNFKEQADRDELASLNADIMVVVAYGLILPVPVLETPKYGCVNVHASLLPRWRGAAPIQRAVEAGDSESGVTIMQMEKGLDTGPMLEVVTCEITADETGGSLHDKLMAIGSPALIKALDDIALGQATPEVQNHDLANYAHKIEKPDLDVQWSESAEIIERKIRAFNPFPVCFSQLNGERIKLFDAECVSVADGKQPGEIVEVSKAGICVATADGGLLLKRLQIPGKKPMPIADLLNGYSDKFQVGQCFNSANS
ncbi:methionyl-tRNA formyltransferase [Sessilibacter corallicola]|uniref:Methionyl-tRNA formyltransferase n=1 Tax=Sessilibacter corallicola TaxID=2904075 RepID=A0ABQ0AB88_9GAMM